MKKLVLVFIMVSFLPVISWGIPITVSVEPSVSLIDYGDIFTVDLMADIPASVLGWGLDFSFNSSVLSMVGSPAIGPTWDPGLARDGDSLAGLSFPGHLAGINILLATLTFEVINLGYSDLIASVTLGDPNEGFPLPFPAPPGSFADVKFENSAVSPIPEPATIILIGIGLGGIGLTGLKNKFIKKRN